MAQADPISTATGEGVSRGGSTKSTSLHSAHTEPAASLAGKPTHLIESEDPRFTRRSLESVRGAESVHDGVL
jgi:hypothetical protein